MQVSAGERRKNCSMDGKKPMTLSGWNKSGEVIFAKIDTANTLL